MDSVVDKKGTRARRRPIWIPLHASRAQEIAATNYYRPRDRGGGGAICRTLSALKLVTIQDFGGWDTAQATYFADGGMFDRIFTPGK